MTRQPRTYGQRRAIALLVTLFFIMAITAVLGVTLTLLQEGTAKSTDGRFLVQSSALLDDVLAMFKSSADLQAVEDAATLKMLLDTAAFIPFSAGDVGAAVTLRSAAGRININTLAASEVFRDALAEYLVRYNVHDSAYLIDLLTDCMGGVQPYYKSDLFEYRPGLYRERIVDRGHLEQVLEFYALMRRDNSVFYVPWDDLVRFAPKEEAKMDANYLSAALWQLLLPEYSAEMTAELARHEQPFMSLDETGLAPEVLQRLEPFGLSVYEPKVAVALTVTEEGREAHIAFEYDLQSKLAREFAYGI